MGVLEGGTSTFFLRGQQVELLSVSKRLPCSQRKPAWFYEASTYVEILSPLKHAGIEMKICVYIICIRSAFTLKKEKRNRNLFRVSKVDPVSWRHSSTARVAQRATIVHLSFSFILGLSSFSRRLINFEFASPTFLLCLTVKEKGSRRNTNGWGPEGERGVEKIKLRTATVDAHNVLPRRVEAKSARQKQMLTRAHRSGEKLNSFFFLRAGDTRSFYVERTLTKKLQVFGHFEDGLR